MAFFRLFACVCFFLIIIQLIQPFIYAYANRIQQGLQVLVVYISISYGSQVLEYGLQGAAFGGAGQTVLAIVKSLGSQWTGWVIGIGIANQPSPWPQTPTT